MPRRRGYFRRRKKRSGWGGYQVFR